MRKTKRRRVLTDAFLRGRKPPKKGRREFADVRCSGLEWRVTASGARSWSFRFRDPTTGATTRHTLGPYPDLGLADARAIVETGSGTGTDRVPGLREMVAAGRNPILERRRARAEAPAKTFVAVVDQFIEHYAKPRQRTWDQTQRVLKNNCKVWLKKPIADITPNDIRTLLREFIAAGHPYKAAITKRWLAKLWRWAYDEDYTPVPIIKGLGNVETEKRERNRFYTDAEIRATWEAADKLEPHDAAYVKLLILLAPRKTALALLRRSHLDDADNPTIWTTPFELTKSRKTSRKKRVYLTPLPPLAQRIVKGLTKNGDSLFPGLSVHETKGGRPTFYGVPLQRKMVEHGAPAHFEFHAWRHTIATWLENQGHSEWERGLALNHSGSGSVTADYSHGYPLELKRTLLMKWAEHVEQLVQPKGAALLR